MLFTIHANSHTTWVRTGTTAFDASPPLREDKPAGEVPDILLDGEGLALCEYRILGKFCNIWRRGGGGGGGGKDDNNEHARAANEKGREDVVGLGAAVGCGERSKGMTQGA